MKDYYNILGVTPQDSEEDIKRAYKRLAKQYHPDVNKSPDAESKFKEINDAYENLTKPQNKGMFFDEPADLWSSFFGRKTSPFANFENFFRTSANVHRTQQITINVDWLTMILGGEKIVSIGRQIQLKIPPLSQNGQTIHIKSSNEDIFITLQAVLPKELTKKQKELLSKIQNNED